MEAEIMADEFIPAGEKEATERIIALLKARLEREYASPRRMLRDAHPKQHGLVRAEFIVAPELPADLSVGVFSQARTYPAWVRFSNMADPPRHDIYPDSRGMAIKVMGVEGEKLLDDERLAKTQDFVLMSTKFFVTRGVEEFANLVEALEFGTVPLLWHFATHPRLLWLFVKARAKCSSPLEIGYGSTTPYLLGEHAVKYFAQPVLQGKTPLPRNPTPDFLREQMVRHLRRQESLFDFCIQVQSDVATMPIEDPRITWSEEMSPFVKVATLRIPVQDFDTPEQHEYGDNLSFTPWHCLPEHRPLGGINRARRAIYEEMSRFRHERNAARRFEPEGWDDGTLP